jgi:hypothetical protein
MRMNQELDHASKPNNKSESAGTEVIVACELGGSLTAKPGADTGFQSRSLKAVYYLKKAGYTNVKHLEVWLITRHIAKLICVHGTAGRKHLVIEVL